MKRLRRAGPISRALIRAQARYQIFLALQLKCSGVTPIPTIAPTAESFDPDPTPTPFSNTEPTPPMVESPSPAPSPKSTSEPDKDDGADPTPSPTGTITPISTSTKTPTPTPTATPTPTQTPFPAGINLALGKVATFTAPPNYSLTNDVNDPYNLTDGFAYSGTSKIFTLQTSVGFSWYNEGVGIQFDLGDNYPIESIQANLGSNNASEVYLPASLFVWVSEDGANWHLAGNLMREAVSQVGNVQHLFKLSGLQTHGRYVHLRGLPRQTFIFLDEVLVLSGSSDPASTPYLDAPISTDAIPSTSLTLHPAEVEDTATLYFIKAAEDSIAANPGVDSTLVLAGLAAVKTAVSNDHTFYNVDRKLGLPYTMYDTIVTLLFGGYIKQLGLPPISAWVKNISDVSVTLPFDRAKTSEPLTLTADMATNERESPTFMLSNNTDQEMVVALSRDSGSSSTGTSVALAFREAVAVLAPGYQFIPEALRVVDPSGLVIPAGVTTEVVVEIDSRDALPGSTTINIAALADSGSFAIIPLTVNVYDVLIADNLDFKNGVWAYYSMENIEPSAPAVFESLQNDRVNIDNHNTGSVPMPSFDSSGIMKPLDFTLLDAAFDLMQTAKLRMLMVGDPDDIESNEVLMLILAGDKANFQNWLAQLIDHMQARGYGFDEWALHPIDEPLEDHFDSLIVPFAQWTKEFNSSVKIVQNWNSEALDKKVIDPANEGLIDICIPTQSRLYSTSPYRSDIINLCTSNGRELYKYDSTSSQSRLGYTDYRLSFWYAKDMQTSGNMKCWYAGHDDIWNTYLGSNQDMAYPEEPGQALTPSKRWFAWRDGYEDYELLRQASLYPDLSGLVSSAVVAAINVSNSKNPTVVRDQRKLLLQAVAAK